jgi:hypothetical protein
MRMGKAFFRSIDPGQHEEHEENEDEEGGFGGDKPGPMKKMRTRKGVSRD